MIFFLLIPISSTERHCEIKFVLLQFRHRVCYALIGVPGNGTQIRKPDIVRENDMMLIS